MAGFFFLSPPTGQAYARDRVLGKHDRPGHVHECSHKMSLIFYVCLRFSCI